MPLQLYNSLTHRKEVFEPIDPQKVRMYVCGPTVYDEAHIGNARAVVVFDLLYRVLRHEYGDEHVTYVRNITDVEDKIMAAARASGQTIDQVTARTTAQFHADMAALGNLPPDVEPDPNSDSFVGTIYLFGLSRHAGHDMAEGGARQTFNITRAVQASRVRADLAKGVTVTVVPTGTDRIMARLATPVPEGAQPFVDAAKGPWVRVEHITVLAIE